MRKIIAFSLFLILLIGGTSTYAHTDSNLPDIGEAEDIPVFPIIVGETSVMDMTGEIRRYSGQFENDDDEILVEFVDLNAGDTIYAYAAGVGTVDTYLYVLNASQTDVFIEDNDSGGGLNAALSYEVQESGTYLIGLISRDGTGEFQLFAGVNTPDIINVQNQAPEGNLAVDFEPFDCSEAEFGDRPTLSGRDQIHEEEDFVVHFTRTGRDRATEEWIDELVIALELSLDTQLNTLGWALPPSDCGEGGDTRLDVYVLDIDYAQGVASPENMVGDNENTEIIEYYAAYSYLLIENDLDFIEDRELAFNEMRTTAAHEVHHNIQFGYDMNDRFFGFYEAGATWIETLVYPEISNAGASVSPVFNTPDACIGSFEGRGSNDARVYGEWILIDSFTRDLGIESYQFIWEYMAANEGLEGFYRALDELGTTPQEVTLRMAVRNLLQDYTLGEYFEDTVRVEATINGTGLISPRRNGVQQLSVDYVRIREQGLYQLELLDGESLELYVVGIDGDTATLYDLGTSGSVDTTGYDYAYAIVFNPAQHSTTDVCAYTDWMLQISTGDEANLAASTGELWDASGFELAK